MCLINLINGGCFRGIRLGMKCEEVIKKLGEPQGVSSTSIYGFTTKYRNLQFHFKDDKLSLIGFYFFEDSDHLLFSKENFKKIQRNTSIDQITCLFDQFCIVWELDKNLTFDDQVCISTNNGVQLFFDTSIEELEKIIFSIPL